MDTRSGPLAIAGAGSLGPRLAGRLTAELILRSPQYMNCCKMYEIELRGISANNCLCGGFLAH
uniref:Uncharacterized protein n=1 Tax=Tetraselmis sp. GSL018 TaxID=582737 RepID=A0A061SG86_9CHLO